MKIRYLDQNKVTVIERRSVYGLEEAMKYARKFAEDKGWTLKAVEEER